MNLATSYLDCSDLYGTDVEDIRNLRSFRDGQVQIENCKRCKEGSALSSLYTILLNHHNQIAEELSEMNQHWEDEVVFEEAKRIVVAEIQHVTYNEFLPVVLGEETMESEDLKLESQRFYTDYSSQNLVNTLNEVATSVLPIFQTMYSEQWVSQSYIIFAKTFFGHGYLSIKAQAKPLLK